MSYNAELWSRPDEECQRRTLINWLVAYKIEFDEDMTLDELKQLYIDIECGKR